MIFSGKVALVTGASSGIGAGTAVKFAKLGAKLALVDCNAEKLKEIATTLPDSSSHLQLRANMCNEDDVQNLIKETTAKLGKLDVLVNSAGILENGSIENTSLEQFDRVMSTNIRSIYHLTMLAVPELKKTKGNIVNISSICGLRAFPNILAYNISKSGVDQFTRCVALELALYGIRCNSVNPGVIITELHKRGGMDESAYGKFLERSKLTHALGRVGEVHEVADAICFLASDKASFITGVNLSIDGGRHAMCPR